MTIRIDSTISYPKQTFTVAPENILKKLLYKIQIIDDL